VLDPVIVWTALEAALKVRRLAIEALRDRPLEVHPDTEHDRVIVRGLGDELAVRVREGRELVVSWAMEAA
jgi:hypothetical protein